MDQFTDPGLSQFYFIYTMQIYQKKFTIYKVVNYWSLLNKNVYNSYNVYKSL